MVELFIERALLEQAVAHLPHSGLVDGPDGEPLLLPRTQGREVLVATERDLVQLRVCTQHLGQRPLVFVDCGGGSTAKLVAVLSYLDSQVDQGRDHADRSEEFRRRSQGLPVHGLLS